MVVSLCMLNPTPAPNALGRDGTEYHDPSAPAEPAGPFPTLTSRERQVALLLAEGKPNREIADELDVSIKTIDTHRGHVLKKLSLKNNVELCRYTIRNGWIEA